MEPLSAATTVSPTADQIAYPCAAISMISSFLFSQGEEIPES